MMVITCPVCVGLSSGSRDEFLTSTRLQHLAVTVRVTAPRRDVHTDMSITPTNLLTTRQLTLIRRYAFTLRPYTSFQNIKFYFAMSLFTRIYKSRLLYLKQFVT